MTRACIFANFASMSVTGIIQNGVVILPADSALPEGMEVSVTPLAPGDPLFLQEALARAKPRDWPADYALNHAHYAKGEPKR